MMIIIIIWVTFVICFKILSSHISQSATLWSMVHSTLCSGTTFVSTDGSEAADLCHRLPRLPPVNLSHCIHAWAVQDWTTNLWVVCTTALPSAPLPRHIYYYIYIYILCPLAFFFYYFKCYCDEFKIINCHFSWFSLWCTAVALYFSCICI